MTKLFYETDHPHRAYYKLADALAGKPFTTVRGEAQFKRWRIGRVVRCQTCNGKVFEATILKLEQRHLCNMELAFIKADAEHPGCVLTSHQQFANLLNVFRDPRWKRPVNTSTNLTIITLQKNLV